MQAGEPLLKIYPTGKEGKLDSRVARKRPQVTFICDNKTNAKMVQVIRPHLGELHSARLRVDLVVFDPDHLSKLAPHIKLTQSTFQDETLEAYGPEMCQKLLLHAMNDWVDFLFTPEPNSLLIYTDHDQFITFFPRDDKRLDRLAKDLRNEGFEWVDYVRKLSDVGYED